ncbi:T9SS type A sorting domain-containing protein [bacterium]|nr:T9SS type A sorting domain-containing protein [bacterium]MBU1984421.1 T9SS type A sorting domain-containing protein [bacterium]
MRILIYLIFVLGLWRAVAAELLGNYSSHVLQDSELRIFAGGSVVAVRPFADGIVRITLSPDGQSWPDSSHVVCLSPEPAFWQLSENDSTLTMQMTGMEIEISKFPVRFHFLNANRLVLADEDGFFWSGEERGVRFRLQPSEHLYGGGERAVSIDRRGQSLDSYNAAHYCYGVGEPNLNITVPFLWSSNGYGVYFDNPYPGRFDVGAAEQTVFEYGVSGGELSYFIIIGASGPELLQRYTLLTGRPPMPPRWALGYLQSRFGYTSESEARSVVQAFRDQGIPLDAIILDLYWFGWGQMGDFDWDRSQWPNPIGMMADFNSLGVKTILITEPYIIQTSSNYAHAYQNRYLTPDSTGIPVVIPNFWAGPAGLLDVTLPTARDWWWTFYADRIAEGVGGWWCDLGEPEAHPSQMVHHDGPAERVHNTYSLRWAKLLYNRYREFYPDQRLFNLIRSGYAGMQRYGTFPWSGDVQRTFAGLQAQLPIILSMGMSGVAYTGFDISGFDCGPRDSEQYIRGMQLGVFAPVMRAHGVGVPPEPIYYDPATREIVTFYINLRYRLLPYNYTLAWENSLSGMPLARPLCMVFNDEAFARLDDEYLWGPSFLIAPALEAGQRTRDVLLPEGVWVDFWTDETFVGESHYSVDARLSKIPVFVRGGSFVPMIPEIESTSDYAGDTLELHYYPDAGTPASSNAMYEDDGMAPDAPEQGLYNTLNFAGYVTTDSIAVELTTTHDGYPGAPSTRWMHVQFHRIAHRPEEVEVSGIPALFVASLAELLTGDSVAYWSEESYVLHTVFSWDGTASNLVLHGTGLLPVAEDRAVIPKMFALDQNVPNPFNASTNITFTLGQAAHATLRVFDLNGRLVATLFQESLAAGRYTRAIDARGWPSGVYFCRLQAEGECLTRKMVLLR